MRIMWDVPGPLWDDLRGPTLRQALFHYYSCHGYINARELTEEHIIAIDAFLAEQPAKTGSGE